MKVILVGHSGSKQILPASSWLIKKYLPTDMEIIFLNCGRTSPQLYVGNYFNLGITANFSPRFWSFYLARFLKKLDDDLIILGLDDFLLSKDLNLKNFSGLVEAMENDSSIVSAHLSISPGINHFEKEIEFSSGTTICEITKSTPYLISTQYSIWRREYLISLLQKVRSPWEFEVFGSRIVSAQKEISVIQASTTTLAYPERSSISLQFPGRISVIGNRSSDISKLIDYGNLDPSKLVLGLWVGAPEFRGSDSEQKAALEGCPQAELSYNKEMLDECLGLKD